MAPRALGALLAIMAAIAFVVSIASSAWWSGHPTVEGRSITAKHVSVGLIGATGCNTGGDGTCEDVETGNTLQLASVIELGAIGLATLLAFLLAISASRIGDRRKGLAKATTIFALLAAVGAGGVLAIGPDITATQDVGVPIGWGTFVFGGGVLSALVASAITRKLEPEPLRLKPGIAPSLPAALPPLYEPRNAGYVPVAQTLPMPGPVEPLGPPIDPFARTEARDHVGGQSPPMAPPPVRSKAPSGAPPARSNSPSSSPPIRSNSPSSSPPMRSNSPSSSPPMRSNSPSGSPPMRPNSPSGSPPPRASAPSVPAPARPQLPATPLPARGKPPSAAPPTPSRTKAASVVPPPRAETDPVPPRPPQRRARTTPGPGTDPAIAPLAAKTSSPAIDPLRPSAPTLAHAIPPMPSPDNLTAPPVLPARPPQRAVTDPDDRLATAMRETEHITSVEVDAEAKARAHAVEHTARGTGLDPRIAARTPRSLTDARTGQREAVVGDITSTGVDVGRAGERIITGEERALSTVQREVARAPTEDPFESGRAGSIVPEDGPLADELAARQSAELAAEDSIPVTEVHPAQSPDDHELGDRLADDLESTSIAEPPKEQTPIPTLHERPATQVPMSTAPASLPPPKATTSSQTASGPTPACPQCESPMAWVEEHLRFYCKQCRMYF